MPDKEVITYEEGLKRLTAHFANFGFENPKQRAKNTIGNKEHFNKRMKARKMANAG